MRQSAEPLGFLVGDVEFPLTSPLGDGTGDCVVQAPVQRVEFRGADGKLPFERKLGDGLAHVAIVVNHLADGKT